MNMTIEFTYLNQKASRYTFEQPQLKEWVESQCKGKVLNLFAGKTILEVDETRVDIDPDCPAHHHCDALEFLKNCNGERFDTIILDPPYNQRKAVEKYNNKYFHPFKKIKDQLVTVIKPHARVITLGYDSVGMGKGRGFKKIAICLICHFGDFNDTICLVEERIDGILEDFENESGSDV